MVESLEPRVLLSTTGADGLTIPTGHARVWFTPARLSAAKSWYAAHPFTPSSSDPFNSALAYQLTGNTTYARNAINQLMNFTISSSELSGVASDTYRWNDWVPVVFDWCYDQMSSGDRSTFMTRYNGYVDTMSKKGWGGPGFESNNYFWGYFRNELNWAVATYYESPTTAKQFLDDALVTRWQNGFLPYATKGGAGGVAQEGTQYGRYMLDYPTIPLASAQLLGRNVYSETNFYREAAYDTIYSTSTSPVSNKAGTSSYYQVFPFNEDEVSIGYPAASNYVDFMTAMAQAYNNTPLEGYARQWLSTVGGSPSKYLAMVDDGGAAKSLSSLPLDYYASGPGYFYTKNTWSKTGTDFNLQLGAPSRVGHGHLDYGSFQINRNGQWLTKESTGYGTTLTGYNGSGTATVGSTIGHNGVLFGGIGLAAANPDGPPQVTRLESRPDYSFASVDLTQAYRATGSSQPARDDNPNVANAVRDFIYVRGLDTTIVFDRLQSTTASAAKTFLLHTAKAPTVSGNTATYTAGSQALKLTTLTPSGQSAPTYKVVNETPSSIDNSTDYQYRLEVNTSGQAQSYFINVLQAKDASAADVKATMTEDATSFTITLTSPTLGTAVIKLAKGMKSGGGSIGYTATPGATPPSMSPLTSTIQQMQVTDAGPQWAGSGGPVVSFAPATYSVNENAGTATITVSRSGDTTVPVAVNYATGNGTATSGSDYTATGGSLSFAAGETSKTFTIPVLNDSTAESDETVNLTLSNPTGGATLGTGSGVLTIVDDDKPGQLQFSNATYNAAENGGAATVTVSRTGGSTGAVSVGYATADGTATAGSDYTATTGTLNFAAGETSKTFAIPILDDTLTEGTETVKLALSNPTGGSALGTQAAALLNITDNERADPFASGLVGYWGFDDVGSGTTAPDSSGNGNAGTLQNGVATTAGHGGGSALSFDGIDDSVRVGRSASLEPAKVSLSAWINLPAGVTQADWSTIVKKEYDDDNSAPYRSWGLNISPGGAANVLSFSTGHANGVSDKLNSPTALPTGRWVHVAGTFDPSTGEKRLYVDGTLVASKTLSSAVVYDTTSTGDVYVGQDPGPGEALKGAVDEVGIWNRALSADEVAALAAGDVPSAPPQQPPPPPADTTAPAISGVTASGVTQTSASVSWSTDEGSDTRVEYGTTTAYGSSTTLDARMVTSHGAALAGLQAGTAYHYRVRSRDAAGNLAVSGDFTFTTAAAPTSATVFSTTGNAGDFATYSPTTPSRWSLTSDATGNKRLFLNTSAYDPAVEDTLGEYALVNGTSYGDFDLTVSAKTNESLSANPSADYALVFGYVDANNYSYLMISARTGNTRFFRVTNGVPTGYAASTPVGIPDTGWHDVKLSRRGSTLTVLLDGNQILSTTNSALVTAGRVGVGSYNDSVYFDDIDVR